jgi:hypothetical protein
MKHLIIFTAFTALCLTATAQEPADGDTVIVDHPQKVVVTTTKAKMNVEVIGKEDNPNYYYSKSVDLQPSAISVIQQDSGLDFNVPFIGSTNKENENKKNANSIEITGLGFGFVSAPGAPNGMDVKMGSSYELFISELVGFHHRWGYRNKIILGIGIDWRNYRMTDQTRFLKQGNNIVLSDYPAGSDIKFSRLKIFSWTFEALYHRSFSHNVGIDFGPVLSLNTYGSLKTRYTDADGKHKDFNKNIHQTPITIDFKARLDVKGIGVYAKYSPCNILQTEYGPKFQSLSFGIEF